MPVESILVYGTKWCPQTAMARQCLETHKVSYTWCDIEQDAAGRAFVEKVNRGKRSVPTIVFPDGSIMVEPSYSELEKKLEK
jgi:mycoredoxin